MCIFCVLNEYLVFLFFVDVIHTHSPALNIKQKNKIIFNKNLTQHVVD